MVTYFAKVLITIPIAINREMQHVSKALCFKEIKDEFDFTTPIPDLKGRSLLNGLNRICKFFVKFILC